MVGLLYLFGSLQVLVGLGVAVYSAANARTMFLGADSTFAVRVAGSLLGGLIGTGLDIVVSGVLLLAVGRILHLVARMEHNTRPRRQREIGDF